MTDLQLPRRPLLRKNGCRHTTIWARPDEFLEEVFGERDLQYDGCTVRQEREEMVRQSMRVQLNTSPQLHWIIARPPVQIRPKALHIRYWWEYAAVSEPLIFTTHIEPGWGYLLRQRPG